MPRTRKPHVHARDHEHGGADPHHTHYEVVGGAGGGGGSFIPPWDIGSAQGFDELDSGPGYVKITPAWGDPGDWTSREFSNGYYRIPTEGSDTPPFARHNILAWPVDPNFVDAYEFSLSFWAGAYPDQGTDNMWIDATIHTLNYSGSWSSVGTITIGSSLETNQDTPMRPGDFPPAVAAITPPHRFWRGWAHWPHSATLHGIYVEITFETDGSATPVIGTGGGGVNSADLTVRMLVPNSSGTVPEPS